MFEWSGETGLAALFASAFVSATVLPGNSEIVLVAVLRAFPERFAEAILLATLKAVRRQHIMAAEEGGSRVRGLFSASQVARQLGMELQTFEVASTFADIEAALVR